MLKNIYSKYHKYCECYGDIFYSDKILQKTSLKKNYYLFVITKLYESRARSNIDLHNKKKEIFYERRYKREDRAYIL